MILDLNAEVSSAQSLSGTSATLSDKSYDLMAASRIGCEEEAVVNVSDVSGTGPTLAVEIVAADDAALTSNLVVVGRYDPTITASMAAKNFYVHTSGFPRKRYLGLRYTMGGTTPAATVTASFLGCSNRQADYAASA